MERIIKDCASCFPLWDTKWENVSRLWGSLCSLRGSRSHSLRSVGRTMRVCETAALNFSSNVKRKRQREELRTLQFLSQDHPSSPLPRVLWNHENTCNIADLQSNLLVRKDYYKQKEWFRKSTGYHQSIEMVFFI